MPPTVSIIIPVFKEVDNLYRISRNIHDMLASSRIKYEVVFVDDNSCDGTVEQLQELEKEFPVKWVVRTTDRGLAKSVVEGFDSARGDYIVVMDADLSHPPETIPQMVALLKNDTADFVVGSRYVTGGSIDEGWSFFRYLNSRAAVLLASLFTRIKDPMSGFFAFKKNLPDRQMLSPVGYKIILEMIVKGAFENIREIPIHFSQRKYGHSKLNLKEQYLYLVHVWRLFSFLYPRLSRYVQFSLVGGTGFLIDMGFYLGTQHLFGAGHLLARAISFWPAVTWNWALNRQFTFNDRKKYSKRIQWLKFACTCIGGFCISWGMYYGLSAAPFFEHFLILDLIIGICAASGFNFLMSYYCVFPS